MSINKEIEILPEILKKEWCCIKSFYSSNKDTIVFEEFKKRYDNFEGPVIEEFLNMSETMYSEWDNWKYRNRYYIDFKTEQGKREKSLQEVFGEFKKFWDYGSKETNLVFKEMQLLSENMLHEWRLKYNFEYPHIYESYGCKYEIYSKKTKATLWEEFKDIWEIDVSSYDEKKYVDMAAYINKIICDDSNYFKEYPRNFFEYREDSNYHSFDNYSILEKFDIARYWENRILDAENYSDSERDSDGDD